MSFHIPWIVSALLIFIFSFFVPESSLDIHMHDTYLVIHHRFIYWIFSVLCLFFALIYFLLKKIMWSKTLSTLHFAVTEVYIFTLLLPVKYDGIAGSPKRYYDYSHWESFRQYFDLNPMTSSLGILFLLAQILFLMNIIGGVCKSLYKR